MHHLLSRILPRKAHDLSTLPLGKGRPLPWHSTPAEARRLLRELGALSMEVSGYPTARLRWGAMTLRAYLEFSGGVFLEGTWFPETPGAVVLDSRGDPLKMQPRLRATTVDFPSLTPKENWNKALEVLGKPVRRERDGSWHWEWHDMHACFRPPREGTQECDQLHFAPVTPARRFEIRNLSPLELYRSMRVRLDFGTGSWETAAPPSVLGVPVKLEWFTPPKVPLKLTISSTGWEKSVQITASSRQAVLTSDGAGGIRIAA